MIIRAHRSYALECGLTAAQAGLGMGVYAIAAWAGCSSDTSLTFGSGGRGAWGWTPYSWDAGWCCWRCAVPVRHGRLPDCRSDGAGVRQDHSPTCGSDHGLFGPRRHFGVNYGFSTSPLMVASVCGAVHRRLIRAWSGAYLIGPPCGCGHNYWASSGGRAQGKGPEEGIGCTGGCPFPASLSSQNG